MFKRDDYRIFMFIFTFLLCNLSKSIIENEHYEIIKTKFGNNPESIEKEVLLDEMKDYLKLYLEKKNRSDLKSEGRKDIIVLFFQMINIINEYKKSQENDLASYLQEEIKQKEKREMNTSLQMLQHDCIKLTGFVKKEINNLYLTCTTDFGEIFENETFPNKNFIYINMNPEQATFLINDYEDEVKKLYRIVQENIVELNEDLYIEISNINALVNLDNAPPVLNEKYYFIESSIGLFYKNFLAYVESALTIKCDYLINELEKFYDESDVNEKIASFKAEISDNFKNTYKTIKRYMKENIFHKSKYYDYYISSFLKFKKKMQNMQDELFDVFVDEHVLIMKNTIGLYL